MTHTPKLLLLNYTEVLGLLEHDEVINAVREAFKAHAQEQARVFPLVRERLDSSAVFGIKSGDAALQGLLGLKVAGYWPDNVFLGKAAHQATMLLIEPATGRPTGLFDANHITTMRTGAAGAIGIELFSRPDSSHACIFGSGVQAAIQLDYALRVRPKLSQVTYLTFTGQADDSFESQFAGRCNLTHGVDADKAVSTADIVITATPSREALFSARAIRAGTHINALGADTKGKRELPEGLLDDTRVFVDDLIQASQVGECQWYSRPIGVVVGDVLVGTHPFQRNADDITVFDMTGLALQDLFVAQLLQRKAGLTDGGQQIAWPW